MEAKINIAEILKDKPQGTKLYSSACGKCELKEADDKSFKISFYSSKFGFMNGGEGIFDKNGNLYDDGECVVFPSKEMRDWLKFTWKKGDVLQHSEYPLTVIFESFEDDTYTSFKCKYCFDFESASKWLVSNSKCSTKHFYKVSAYEAKEFIKKVELNYNGKLNLETLKIEKHQPEFKDGYIVYAESDGFHYPSIHILNINGDTKRYYARLVINGRYDESIDYDIPAFDNENPNRLRLATEEEKQQLFSALEKEGKSWDAEKKQIVELKPKFELKPFDKVLCRNSKDDTWEADFFARLTRKEIDYTQSGKYLCVGDLWMYCIPYNEETAHLLGTTDEWKGGEQ